MMLLSFIKLTVPTAKFGDINVFALKQERRKWQTQMNKVDIKKKELNQLHHMKQKLESTKRACTEEDVNQNSK